MGKALPHVPRRNRDSPGVRDGRLWCRVDTRDQGARRAPARAAGRAAVVRARCGLHREQLRAKTCTHSIKETRMSTVRVLVGTRKGAFILTADAQRARWEVSGPH